MRAVWSRESVSTPPAVAKPAAIPVPRPASAASMRVLLVDDEEANRDMLSRRLERAGFAVTCVESGTAALLTLEQAGLFDLVLLDVSMPVMDGFATLEALRARPELAHLPVIMVTARDQVDDVVRALTLGATDYVTKPVNLPILLARIEVIAARRRAELALRASAERFTLAMRGSNDGLWDWDIATGEIYYSPRFMNILGLAEEERVAGFDLWLERVHPADRGRVTADLRGHIDGVTFLFQNEHRLMHATGGYRWVLARGVAARSPDGTASRVAGSLADINDRRVLDPVTRLPNRDWLADRIDRILLRTPGLKRQPSALVIVGLGRQRDIAHGLGHAAAERSLQVAAERISSSLRPTDVVTRVAGEQFCVLLERLDAPTDALQVAERISAAVGEMVEIDGQPVDLAPALGIAVDTGSYDHAETYFREAAIALDAARAIPDAPRIAIFQADMEHRARRRLGLETDLRDAVRRDELEPYLQPIVAMETARVTGFEVLLRWPHHRLGMVSPGEFIPIAERNGLIVPLTESLLRRVAAPGLLPAGAGFLSVNLSARHLASDSLLPFVHSLLEETGFAPDRLKFELTETAMLSDEERAKRVLGDLRDLGIHIALDDFGTGYSALRLLAELPLSCLKIDRSLVMKADADPKRQRLLRGILEMSTHLGLDVVAEGIETEAERALLVELGCPSGQGFFFARPMPVAEALKLVGSSAS